VPAYRAFGLPEKRTGPRIKQAGQNWTSSRNIDPQQHDEEKQGWIQHHSQSVRTPALIASPLVHGTPLFVGGRVLPPQAATGEKARSLARA
jgi:hypothetical protein